MKMRKTPFIAFVLGLTCGAIFVLILGKRSDQLVNINLLNESGKIIQYLSVEDDILHNKCIVEKVKPEEEISISIFARNEIGYILTVYLEGGKMLSREVYAEKGYTDNFRVSSDSIIYYPGLTY